MTTNEFFSSHVHNSSTNTTTKLNFGGLLNIHSCPANGPGRDVVVVAAAVVVTWPILAPLQKW